MLTVALCYEIYRYVVSAYKDVDALKRKISAPLSIPIASRTVQNAAAEMLRYCKRRGEYKDLLSVIWHDAVTDGRSKDLDGVLDLMLETTVVIGVCNTPELSIFEKRRKTTVRETEIFLNDFMMADGGLNVFAMETACDACTHVIFAIGTDVYYEGGTEKTCDYVKVLEKQFYCTYFRDIPTYFFVPSDEADGLTMRSMRPRVQSILNMHQRKRLPEGVTRYDGTEFDVMTRFLDMCVTVRTEKESLMAQLAGLRGRSRTSKATKKKVFISYSHKDAESLKRIDVHLKAIKHLGAEEIRIWDDTRIDPGDKWYEEIMQSIDDARIAVLLISADFFASDFIMYEEWPRIRAARDKGLEILPVIIGPSAFLEIAEFKDIQAVNDPSRPVASVGFSEAEIVFNDLRQAVEARLRN